MMRGPTPGEPDVVHVFPATDEEFRNQHDGFERGGYEDYDGYVRRIFDNTNEYLMDTFSDEPETPHLVITTNENGEWGRWDNPPAGITDDTPLPIILDRNSNPVLTGADDIFVEMRQMREDLEWPVRDGQLDRRGADVLSGFSGQPMTEDEGTEALYRQFVDAVSGTPEGESDRTNLWSGGTFDEQAELTGGATLIGTNDPISVTNSETVPRFYMHELGHVLGAVHPNNDDSPAETEEFGIEPGKNGVMCKSSCTNIELTIGVDVTAAFPPDINIFTADFFSQPNRKRILNLDYDFKDEGEDEQENVDNRARNLSTVSTAASTSPPPENIDIDD